MPEILIVEKTRVSSMRFTILMEGLTLEQVYTTQQWAKRQNVTVLNLSDVKASDTDLNQPTLWEGI